MLKIFWIGRKTSQRESIFLSNPQESFFRTLQVFPQWQILQLCEMLLKDQEVILIELIHFHKQTQSLIIRLLLIILELQNQKRRMRLLSSIEIKNDSNSSNGVKTLSIISEQFLQDQVLFIRLTLNTLPPLSIKQLELLTPTQLQVLTPIQQ